MPEKHAKSQARKARPRPAEPNWQKELARAFTNVPDLLDELELDPMHYGTTGRIVENFPLRVPRGFVAQMRKGDFSDPLLRQVLPVVEEAIETPGFVVDPVGDLPSARSPGLLQKYRGRALLIVTGACAVHCRYCFRRAFPYREASMVAGETENVLRTLAADKTIEEVILSGGDPLSLSDSRIDALLSALESIPHVRRIRIHTRFPVVLPERVDAGLLATLERVRKPLIVVVHSNHANEIDDRVAGAMTRLQRRVRILLNQSVLLRGVNDSEAALTNLSERLFEIGVVPYYLHQLDAAKGTAHFRVSDDRAIELMNAVAARLPGYLVPRLVREVPGALSKTWLPLNR